VRGEFSPRNREEKHLVSAGHGVPSSPPRQMPVDRHGSRFSRAGASIENVRVAIVAESFLPQVNGVTNSVLRVLEHLRETGHEALVIAPNDEGVPSEYAGFPVIALNAMSLPGYADVRIGLTPTSQFERIFADFAPDVVHLAAPFSMGYNAVLATSRMSIPSVAVFQTEIAAYASSYGWARITPVLWHRLRRIHSLATLTLAPSTYTARTLMERGVPRVRIWGRGVDSVRFSPSKRDETLRAELAPNGEVIVGYMGRLAPEKQVADLAVLAGIPDTRLVIVGDGPMRAEIEAALPDAYFCGKLAGDELPRVVASMDIFVHPGELETFGQAIQEAEACGVPVIATGIGGPLDLIQPDVNGLLYPPGDLTTMRAYVEALVTDPVCRDRLAAGALAAVEHRTWSYICDQLLTHYDDACSTVRHGELEVV
jgi:phosphatidylinositol alpha 1,6-mannosyltransferase